MSTTPAQNTAPEPAASAGPDCAPSTCSDHSPFQMHEGVWCVFAEGVEPGCYMGSKTFPSKTPGKPDWVAHYVALAGRDYAQYVDLQFVHRTYRAAQAQYKEAARQLIAHMQSTAGL